MRLASILTCKSEQEAVLVFEQTDPDRAGVLALSDIESARTMVYNHQIMSSCVRSENDKLRLFLKVCTVEINEV